MQYRKKPVIIEAFQLQRRQTNWPMWAHDALTENKIVSHNSGKFHNPNEETYLIIKTLEGEMKVNLGDWVIKGIKGEIYPCKDDIFQMTYETIYNEEIDNHIHVMPTKEKHYENKECWCSPRLSYKDEFTQKEVWLHNAKDEAH